MARERVIKVTVVGDATSVGRAFKTVGGQASGLGGNLKKLAGLAGFAGLGLAAKGAFEMMIGSAGQMEETMAKIEGLVGVNKDTVAEWGEQVKRISGDTTIATTELADAMFFISSAGLRGEAAVDALEASAKAAAAGLGATEDIAFAAVSAVNAYGVENLNAAEAVDILTNTVRQGNVEASTIAPTLGRIIPIAAEMGVSFDQVGASIAAMTRLGESADGAVTALRGTLTTILKPTQGTRDAFNEVGLSVDEMRDNIMSGDMNVLDALLQLKDAFGGNIEMMTKAFPNVKALSGVLQLVGSNAEASKDIFYALADSAGTTDEAFGVMAETANFTFREALNNLKIAGQEVGEAILPKIAQAVEQITPRLIELAPAFGDLIIVLMDLAENVIPVLVVALDGLNGVMSGLRETGLRARADFGNSVAGAMAEAEAGIRQFGSAVKDHGMTPAEAMIEVIQRLIEKNELNNASLGYLQENLGLTDQFMLDALQATADLTEGFDAQAITTDDLAWQIQQYNASSEVQRAREEEAAAAVAAKDQALYNLAGQMADTEDSTDDLTDSTDDFTESTDEAREAREELTGAMLAAISPAVDTAKKIRDMEEAQRELEEAQNDGSLSAEDLALKQLEVAEQTWEAQAAFDSFSAGNVEAAIGGIAQALGISDEAAADLLTTLGLIDGSNPVIDIDVRAPIIRYTKSGDAYVPGRGGKILLQRGGILTGPTDIWGNAMAGEAGAEAVIPLNNQGVDWMAETMKKAMQQSGSFDIWGGGGGGVRGAVNDPWATPLSPAVDPDGDGIIGVPGDTHEFEALPVPATVSGGGNAEHVHTPMIIQLVIDGAVLAEAIIEHNRSLS